MHAQTGDAHLEESTKYSKFSAVKETLGQWLSCLPIRIICGVFKKYIPFIISQVTSSLQESVLDFLIYPPAPSKYPVNVMMRSDVPNRNMVHGTVTSNSDDRSPSQDIFLLRLFHVNLFCFTIPFH